MRALEKFTAGLFVFVALIAAAAWFVPPLLDWNRFRETGAALATRQLGRPVSIEGPVSLTLLPHPALLVSRVAVAERADGNGGDGLKISVKVARISIAFWPLLGGTIVAQDVALRGLDVSIPGPPSGGMARIRTPSWLRARSAHIEEGRVAIGGLVFSGIEATLSADELTGGYRAAGTTEIAGDAWRFTGLLSQPGGDGAAAVELALDGQGRLAGDGFSLSGQMAGDGVFGGFVRAGGPDLSQLIAAPKIPFRAEGRVSVAAGLAAADDLELQLGPAPARAAISARLSPAPRLDIAVAASTLDLDLWLPVLRNRPSGFDLGVDISAEAAPLAGGTLRHLRAAFDIGAGKTAVREFSASLPGDAAVRLTGDLSPSPNGGPRFEGDGTLDAPSARATLAWLEDAKVIGVPPLPDGFLHAASAAAHMTVERDAADFSDLSGTMDGEKFSGAVSATFSDRLAARARLNIGLLDLSAFDPAKLPPPPTLAAAFDLDLKLNAARVELPGIALSPFSLDAALDHGRLAVRKAEAGVKGVHVTVSGAIGPDGKLADARCDIDGASAEALAPIVPPALQDIFNEVSPLARRKFTIAAQASGPASALALRVAADLDDLRVQAEPLIDIPGGALAGPLTLHHPGASRLAETLGLRGAPAWLGDGSFGAVGTVSASRGKIGIASLDVTAGVLHAAGDLAIDAAGGRPRVAGKLVADSIPVPALFPRSIDPLGTEWLSAFDADIDMKAADIEIPGAPPIQDASGNISLANGALAIRMPRSRFAMGDLSASMAFDSTARPPRVALAGDLSGAIVSGPLLHAPIDLVSGLLSVKFAIAAAGYSPAAFVATLGGTLHADARNGELAGVDLAAIENQAPDFASDAAIRGALAAGSTKFNGFVIDGVFDHGLLGISNATLKSSRTTARVEGVVDLASPSVDLRVSIAPPGAANGNQGGGNPASENPSGNPASGNTASGNTASGNTASGNTGEDAPPVIGLRLTGPLDAPVRTPQLAGLAQWRALRQSPPVQANIEAPAR